MIPDAHDPRRFQHYAKFNADGTIAGIVEIAVGSAAPTDGVYVNVTSLYPYQQDALAVEAGTAKALGAAMRDREKKAAAWRAAAAAHDALHDATLATLTEKK